MAIPARWVRAERDVVRQCRPGLPADELQRQALRALRRHVTVDAAFAATADPATLLMTGAVTEEPLAAAAPAFLASEYGPPDVNHFRTLAVGDRPVRTLDVATRRDRAASSRYRDVLRPLGLGDELRVALTVGGECWGYWCLHRADATAGFSRQEAELVARVAPHVATALRQAVLAGRTPSGSPAGPGVVLIGDDLEPAGTTPAGDELLALLPPGPDGSPLPVVVRAVAAALRRDERAEAPAAGPPRARVRAADGTWLTVTASRVRAAGDAGPVAVVLEPATPADTVPLLLAACGLTAREAEVARLVLRGASTRAIGAALHLSEWTVQDHLKAVFDKVGVRSRRELVGTLAGRAAGAPG